MTGDQVAALRTCLGLSPGQLAGLCGVHPASVYRWEAARAAQPRIEPLQQSILAALNQECVRRREAQRQAQLGNALAQGLLIGGTLMGLAVLLEGMFPKQPKRRRPRAAGRKRTA